MSPLKTALAASLCLLGSGSLAATPQKIAVFPFVIQDTSGDPVAGRDARIATATKRLAQTLADTGKYQPVDLAPFAKEIAALQAPDECGSCWADVAKKAGADLEVLPNVHKVSTLITLMTFWIADVHSMKYIAHISGQIRGDTDEAYARGIKFLVSEELLKPKS